MTLQTAMKERASFFGNPPNVANPTVYNVTGYQNVAGGVIAPTSMSIIPQTAKFPSIQQFSFGIQHQFSGNNVLSVSYVGSAGRHLLQSRNQNQVYPGETTQNVPALAGSPGCTSSGICDVQYILINNLQPATYLARTGDTQILHCGIGQGIRIIIHSKSISGIP